MHKGILLVVVITLLLPSTLALSCDLYSGEDLDICNNIIHSGLSEEEQVLLLNLGTYKERSVPNHDFVYYWNTHQTINNAPDGTIFQNSGIIRNAWIRIISLMPSITENNTLYCDNHGSLQSAYNYNIQLPTGTASGDCRTEYSLDRESHDFNAYLNNILIGKDKISSFTTSGQGDMFFTSELNIEARTKVDHYRNYRYCCRYSSSGRCKRWCTSCDFSHTDYTTDTLSIRDSQHAISKNEQPFSNFSIQNYNNGMINGKLIADNYTLLVFDLGNAEYKKSNYIYEITHNLHPYDILSINAKPFEEKATKNIKLTELPLGFDFVAPYSRDCSIKLSNHFNTYNISCLVDYISKNLSIKTDKLNYFANESINIDISPKNTPIFIQYGNTSITTQNSINFTAEEYSNRVSASYGSEITEKVISVTKRSTLILASKILMLIGLNYIIFSFLTKSSFISKWLTAHY